MVDVAELIHRIRSGDTETRMTALVDAPSAGSEAIVPLGDVMAGEDKAAARAAQEALRRIGYSAGKSGSNARSATLELVKLIGKDRPRGVRSDALLLLRQMGTAEAVMPLADQLNDPDVGEEARMALERIPGSAAEQVLKNASAADMSLRRRKQTMKNVGIR